MTVEQVWICDRCGATYKPDIEGNKDLRLNDGWTHRTFDLCPECAMKFMSWLKEPAK